MNNVAFIPVRGGSTSIPLKNIKPICGKPLVYWTALAASKASSIDAVFISTDSSQIKECVESFNLPKVQVINRSPETATNTASSESALLEFADNYEFNNVAFIQATSPLLTRVDIDEAFQIFNCPDCDSVLSVVEDKHFYWQQDENGIAKELNYDVFNRPRRQDFEGCFQENGALYITSKLNLLESQNRVSGKIKLYVMPEETAYEIDEPHDWVIIERLLSQRIKINQEKEPIRLFLTDCDGCLTDAGMYYTEQGDEIKKFNTRDGKGIELLRNCGIKTGIITSENSRAVARRAEKLKMDYLELGCKDKLAAAKEICRKENISLSEVAYVGDDLNDLDLLEAVGLSFAPSDACKEAKGAASITAQTSGGKGVIREAAEIILHAR